MTFRKDLLIAAFIAIAVHAGASLIATHERSILPLHKENIKRNLVISLVSTYREPEKSQPSAHREEERVIIKENDLKKNNFPVKKSVQPVKKKAAYKRPVDTTGDRKSTSAPVVELQESKKTVKMEVRGESEQTEDAVEKKEETPVVSEPGGEIRNTSPAMPRYSENPPPSYPSIARRRGYEGLVTLSVEILEDGTVGGLSIKKTSGYSILDDAAVKTVREWRFKPGYYGDNPISMWVEVPIRFEIR
ncbi:MAG: energy transducer TonB [Deltaproteobacteria bacterium]|nr:energy transducer TonB [Deltaproteobacteria bacterium]